MMRSGLSGIAAARSAPPLEASPRARPVRMSRPALPCPARSESGRATLPYRGCQGVQRGGHPGEWSDLPGEKNPGPAAETLTCAETRTAEGSGSERTGAKRVEGGTGSCGEGLGGVEKRVVLVRTRGGLCWRWNLLSVVGSAVVVRCCGSLRGTVLLRPILGGRVGAAGDGAGRRRACDG